MEGPTVDELLASDVVQAGFASAWADSFADTAVPPHEEGGFIIMNTLDFSLLVHRGQPGTVDSFTFVWPDLEDPWRVVAIFHTHPNSKRDGWRPMHSDEDLVIVHDWNLPSFVISEAGIFIEGPACRPILNADP
jgi:hypothetical protein